MTVYNTLQDFKKFVEEVARNERLLTKTNKSKSPQVKVGYLDDDDNLSDQEDFPYIIIRYLKDQTDDDEVTVSIRILIGIYSEDNDGWVDILHCMELLKREILKRSGFDFYRVAFPIKCTIPEEHPVPHFVGSIELDLNIPIFEVEGVESQWQA